MQEIKVNNTVYKTVQNSVYETTSDEVGQNSVIAKASEIACPVNPKDNQRTYQP